MTERNASAKLADPAAPENPKNFCKYCSDDPRVIEDIFERHKIRFTQPAALNDPLEFNPVLRFERTEGKYTSYVFDGVVFPSEEERLRSAFIESQLNIYGILSLTKVWDSFDMWSQYANGHKGFLLELKADFAQHACMLSKDGESYEVYRVEYVGEYAVDVEDLVDANDLIPFATFNKQLFYTKISRWAEEKEYRMVRKLSDNPTWRPVDSRPHRDQNRYLFDFSLDCINRVIFGACMKPANKRRIMSACESTDIKFGQAYVVRDQKDRWGYAGKVRLAGVRDSSEASPWGDLELVCQLNNLDRLRITVGSLEELPYYRVDKERCDMHYKRQQAQRDRRRSV